MSVLDILAIENLRLLGDTKDIQESRLIVDGYKIQTIESPNDEYDPMLSLKELTYPVLFSFYRTFNLVETSTDRRQQEMYMHLMDSSLDNLHYLINQTEEDSEVWTSFKMIVDDLEDSYTELDESYMKQSLCERIFISLDEYFNRYMTILVRILGDSKKYLYLTPMTEDLDEDSSDSEGDAQVPPDSESDSDSDSYSDTEKED